MTYVYVLSEYSEYGAERAVATMQRDKLLDLLRRNWPDQNRDHEEQALAASLEQSDVDISAVGSHDLSDSWGGIQFHVIRLDATAKEQGQ